METLEMELWDEAGSRGEETRLKRGLPAIKWMMRNQGLSGQGLAIVCCDWPSHSTPHPTPKYHCAHPTSFTSQNSDADEGLFRFVAKTWCPSCFSHLSNIDADEGLFYFVAHTFALEGRCLQVAVWRRASGSSLQVRRMVTLAAHIYLVKTLTLSIFQHMVSFSTRGDSWLNSATSNLAGKRRRARV